MTQEQLKISLMARTFGVELIKRGISIIRNGSLEFTPSLGQLRILNNAFDKIGISITPLDISYGFASLDNWKKITELLYAIIKDFKWEAELFDCDDRSLVMSGLSSMLFRLNTCGRIYCEVKSGTQTFLHYANVIVLQDESLYLFDVDNGGQMTKITSVNPVMGNWTYNLKSARFS